MQITTTLVKRQLWALPSDTPTPDSSHHCSPHTLEANGVLSFGPDNVVTLSQSAVFTPLCTSTPAPGLAGGGEGGGGGGGGNPTHAHAIPPFYASSTPQVFVVAAAMVLAWVLVIMLIISPRTYRHDTGVVTFATRRGIITGAHGGSTSVMGIGSRPWLQKAAALTVAISLTIAVADTFTVSQKHYPVGINGNALRALVEDSLEIRISRVISDIFVLLAQVQTLIRVFPRHKEKVLIKWIGFALIILDITFESLNSFLPEIDYRRPRDFVDAIPALSYLFELALSLLYSAWIVYYAFTKRQYAFYHPKMKTITFIAFLAIIAIMTPTVFFVLDITLPNIAGWGDYFRWVGDAAASVVVWEWVERIEMLERDEKKDGILGREIFEGDEMLDINSTEEMIYHGRRNDEYFSHRRGKGGSGGTRTFSLRATTSKLGHGMVSIFRKDNSMDKTILGSIKKGSPSCSTTSSSNGDKSSSEQLSNGSGTLVQHGADIQLDTLLTPPAPALTPPSRSDTTSATSTVYVVRQDGSDAIQTVRRRLIPPVAMDPDRTLSEDTQEINGEGGGEGEGEAGGDRSPTPAAAQRGTMNTTTTSTTTGFSSTLVPAWHTVTNPFKRKRTTPPAEVRAAMRGSSTGVVTAGVVTAGVVTAGDATAGDAAAAAAAAHRRGPSLSSERRLNLNLKPSWDFRARLGVGGVGGLRSRVHNQRQQQQQQVTSRSNKSASPGSSSSIPLPASFTSSPPSAAAARQRRKKGGAAAEEVQWTVIPAQPRGQTWMPSPSPPPSTTAAASPRREEIGRDDTAVVPSHHHIQRDMSTEPATARPMGSSLNSSSTTIAAAASAASNSPTPQLSSPESSSPSAPSVTAPTSSPSASRRDDTTPDPLTQTQGSTDGLR